MTNQKNPTRADRLKEEIYIKKESKNARESLKGIINKIEFYEKENLPNNAKSSSLHREIYDFININLGNKIIEEKIENRSKFLFIIPLEKKLNFFCKIDTSVAISKLNEIMLILNDSVEFYFDDGYSVVVTGDRVADDYSVLDIDISI